MTTHPPENAPASSNNDDIKETFRTVVYAMLIALVIRTFAFEPFNIPSGSMEPTLHIGDYLFVSKYTYGYGSRGTFWGYVPFKGRIGGEAPKRGDIVVFKWPRDNSTDYIKRLIGLPGDTVEMRQGLLYVNGVPVGRDRLSSLIEPLGPLPANAADYIEHLPGNVDHIIRKFGDDNRLDNVGPFVVPEGHYFMMGDNRDNSRDSRDPDGGVGFVPEENLVGRAEIIFFSMGDHFSIRWNRMFKRIGE